MKDEYIRKQDAVDALEEKEHEPWYLHKDLEWMSGVVEAKDEIKSLEPADVAPVVHGRWIWKPTKQYCPPDCWYPPLSCNEETWDEKNGTWLEDEMYCSECDYHNYHEIKYNFCPDCGADMRGE